MSRVRLLIFDIDLTICDNFERKRRSLERALGRTFTNREWRRVKYRYGFRAVLKELQPDKPPSAILSISKRILHHFFYDDDLFQFDKPFPRAVETLRQLADEGYIISYLTGRPIRRTAEDFLRKYRFPEGRLLNEKVSLGQSHKKVRLMKRMLRELNVSPEETIAVGDLPDDAEAAKEAGIRAVCTLESRGFDEYYLRSICDETIRKITEL
ncbi:MAG: HAD family hydrolase, partial [Candidatus Bathyarchaeia archaeon]